jgi:hypothetical protein
VLVYSDGRDGIGSNHALSSRGDICHSAPVTISTSICSPSQRCWGREGVELSGFAFIGYAYRYCWGSRKQTRFSPGV